jgi:hypothetical protein
MANGTQDITAAILAAQQAQARAASSASAAKLAASQSQSIFAEFLSLATTWKGAWSALATYRVNDMVEDNGSSYICREQHTNHEPPNDAFWDLVVAKGEQGDPGTGGGVITVDDLAALAALDASAYTDGQQTHVNTLKHLYNLEPISGIVLTDRNLVAALNKAGYYWMRDPKPTGFWFRQTTWEVNGVSGDDEATGAEGDPIKTWDEFNRRTDGAESFVDWTVILSGSTPGNDVLRPNIKLKYDDVNETFAALWIIGTPTVLYSGSVTGGVVNVGNTFPTVLRPTFTDSAIPTSFTASGLVGKLWKRTDGTRAYTWIDKDAGSKTAYTSVPMNTKDAVADFGGLSPVNMGVGNTYDILDLPEMAAPLQSNPDINSSTIIQTCRILGNLDGGLYDTQSTVTYRLCSIASGVAGNGQILSNCHVDDASLFYFEGNGFACDLVGGLVSGVGSTALLLVGGAYVRFGQSTPTTFSRAIFGVLHRSNAEDIRALFYDTVGDMVTVSGMSKANIKAMGGSGNVGNFLLARDPGDMVWVDSSQMTPAMTLDGFPYKAGTQSYLTPELAGVQFPRTGIGIMPGGSSQSTATLRVYKECIPTGPIVSSGVANAETVLARHMFVSLDDFLISFSNLYNLVVSVVGDMKVSGGTGTIRLRIDGTIGAADGTPIAAGTISNTSYSNSGSVFSSNFAGQADGFITGRHLMQITLANDTGGQTTTVDCLALEIRQP